MKRYHIPRLAFINKLDRQGANPDRVIGQLRDKLKLNASAVQIPIGLEDAHKGVVDLVRDRAVVFKGPNGDEMEIVFRDVVNNQPIPGERWQLPPPSNAF